MTTVKLLLGDEAIAQGALDAGISGCYAYPGTPSTEITEYVQASPEAKARRIACQWACNEKTAMEEALGMSYAGRRAITCMKHVGLNVAADGFMNAAITGVNGGLMVVAADDPSMHSSQNEQDSRFYGRFAQIPTLEPASQQEAYDMMRDGLEMSEQWQVPVLMRLTTRLAHSRANVKLRVPHPENPLKLPNSRRFVLLPSTARNNYATLLGKQPAFLAGSEASPYNRYEDGKDTSLGIVACGIAYNYVQEAFDGECPHPVVKISQYPVPAALLRRLFKSCGKILVLEDGMPFVESQCQGVVDAGPKVHGRLDGTLPLAGELTPDLVAKALGHPIHDGRHEAHRLAKPRPPRLCQGCPHIFAYNAIKEALGPDRREHVFADIGCYTLGALPPFDTINACVDMGASISMAKGAADAGVRPAVAVIGDSTFTHSGMTSLLDAVWADSPITVVILDNYTTGMTGGQDSAACGKLESIVLGLGVSRDHFRILDPHPSKHAANIEALKEELAHGGLSVVIFQRECIQTLRRKHKSPKAETKAE